MQRPEGEPPHPDYPWWCPNCGEWVECSQVTFEETHDPREGGCGQPVE